MSFFRLSPFAFFLALVTSCGLRTQDPIRQSFLTPPDSARPGVYWYFMDGNLDRQAMTADLESMKQAGIGYVLFLEVNVGVPRGKVDMLSDEWQVLFRHAVKECERLGIRLIMGSGPGWAGSGGPWVKPEESMLHLVASSTEVKGPISYTGVLPMPENERPFFGEGSVPENFKKIRSDYYQDKFVLAFPTPAVQMETLRIDEKALYQRAPYTSQPGVVPYIPMAGSYEETPGAAIDRDNIINLTGKMNPDGTLSWEVPPGKWTILRFGTRNNGAITRPAPVPGLGFEVDKFDTAAFDKHFDAYIGKLIRKSEPKKGPTGGGWTMIHIDSWEMGAQNWSPRFREEFQKRRGYDPLPFLPAYTGLIVGSEEITERFLWDLRQTSNELILENHAGRFKTLGQKYGMRLSIEPYDMNPAADLDLGGVADVPMCEFWSDGFGFNSAFSCIEATSIAHILGKPVVAAEAFTAGHDEAWKQHPGSMKNQGDWAFAMGINRVVYHTFAHKPYGDNLLPGVTMGPYGVHWDRGQTWWEMSDAYHLYMTRCQYLLSQGTPVADILYLAPEGAPQVFRAPASALDGTEVLPDKKGFSFDGCSPLFLIRDASVKDGRIVFPGGASYAVLILPDIPTMTPELLTKISELANAGAKIIGNPPIKSPSLSGYPDCDSVIKTLASAMQNLQGLTHTTHTHTQTQLGGLGRVSDKPALETRRISGTESEKKRTFMGKITEPEPLKELYPNYDTIAQLLKTSGLTEDFTASGAIRYHHRSLPDREVYFISNRTDQAVNDVCRFRDGTLKPELWDAVTGVIRPLEEGRKTEGGISLNITLEPYQSYFVIFYPDDSVTRHASRVTDPTPDFPLHATEFTLNGPWTVSFDTAWGGPAKIVLDKLEDWSKRPEEGIRYYSGTARYSIGFDVPDLTAEKMRNGIYLDLGVVKNMARVTLNGKDLGVMWTSPWRINISKAIRYKSNTLEVEVVNLWINRLIGDEHLPDDGIKDGRWPDWLLNGTARTSGRYTFTTHRFYGKDSPLAESGLVGPVKIAVTE
ncbi:MAG TPA: glycosyl hydrolase [Bacteroidales bacterium]|nr:glycosyl hydrolase [Bacteroidales bacterium]